MTNFRIPTIAPRIFGVVLLASLVTACAKVASSDYCDNHQRFHESHADNIGRLDVVVSENGKVGATLMLPREILDDGSEPTVASKNRLVDALSGAGRVLRIQAAESCKESASRLNFGATPLSAQYEFDCHVDTRVRQIDINLFDVLPEIDEVDVQITTPAAGKHFAISRKCDKAIFRLQKRSDH